MPSMGNALADLHVDRLTVARHLDRGSRAVSRIQYAPTSRLHVDRHATPTRGIAGAWFDNPRWRSVTPSTRSAVIVTQIETRTILPPPRTLRGRKAQKPSASFRTQALERFRPNLFPRDRLHRTGVQLTHPPVELCRPRSRPLRILRAFHAIEDLRRERKPVVGRQL